MPTEELLCSANNVSDYDRGAQREDDVLIVWMKNQSFVHLACKEKSELAYCPYWFLNDSDCQSSVTLTLESDDC